MENERSYRSGFSAIGITAVLSVVVLVGAVGWKIAGLMQDKNAGLSVVASAASASHSGIPLNNPAADYTNAEGQGTTDPLSPSVITDNVASALAADYAALQQNGSYSTTTAAQVAQQLGTSLKASVSYKTYSASDIKTSPDTSSAAMLAYRASLQTSLAPLLKITSPELDALTEYVQTNNPSYLTQLQQAADNYKLAAAQSAQVVVPADAVTVQIGILDAMQEFAATLNQMAVSVSDPFAEATLVNTYMQAQSDMFTSFNNLYAYYQQKQS